MGTLRVNDQDHVGQLTHHGVWHGRRRRRQSGCRPGWPRSLFTDQPKALNHAVVADRPELRAVSTAEEHLLTQRFVERNG